jgi:uncharacterized protein (DUF58 family)
MLRSALLARRRRPGARGAGAPSPRRGDRYEFAEVRAYVPGDDPRRIDWAATARTDALQTRVLFEDHALTLAACVDASPSMRVGRTRAAYDVACEAAEFWYGAAIEDDRCVRIGDGNVVRSRSLRGRAAAAFCSLHREDAARLREGLELALAALPRDASLLIVSDFYEIDALESSLRACTARFDATALLVRDPWRAELPLSGFVALQDAESGRVARAFVGRKERERYVAAVAERETRTLARLEACGARAGFLEEDDVERAMLRAFGIG